LKTGIVGRGKRRRKGSEGECPKFSGKHRPVLNQCIHLIFLLLTHIII
jgi:hypothetical protein